MTAIQLEALTFQYNKRKKILDNVNLSIGKGEAVGIIGESGVGKTTLLRLMNGSYFHEYERQIKGSIFIDGQRMAKEEDFFQKIGTIYQNPDNQIIFSNVTDELAFGMENMCISPEIMRSKIDEVLKMLAIEHLRDRNPNTLSGGEKQLVTVAAILCLDIGILILDECMAQVDAKGKVLITEAIRRMKTHHKTVVMVEHDYENLRPCDRIYKMEAGKLQMVAKEDLKLCPI
ncbi:ABC transporter ATP-binding protein [Fusibacter paucivorans]|uniref:ABC transporter ATP-binding protein n=1 Tax=Fusibacter paucivorans TaxID=76009 RepID=A0ABS5PPR2_9FIRM|nr:ABC transporter ATP-binding protein [Fusibacter paucivorans]MBS7526897.1 ABC transporter ATP-binding protein [Fusibacter paucivorans]